MHSTIIPRRVCAADPQTRESYRRKFDPGIHRNTAKLASPQGRFPLRIATPRADSSSQLPGSLERICFLRESFFQQYSQTRENRNTNHLKQCGYVREVPDLRVFFFSLEGLRIFSSRIPEKASGRNNKREKIAHLPGRCLLLRFE